MRLIRLKEFRILIFPLGSAPGDRTLRTQIRNKELPGGCMFGGRYYVDLDEFERATNFASRAQEKRSRLAGTSALEGLV